VRDKPIYDSSLFWVGFAAVLVVIGGILVGIGVADVGANADTRLWSDWWFRFGVGFVGLGLILLWWALTLYLAHRHAETHLLRGELESRVAQAPAPRLPESFESKQTPPVPRSAPKENIDLDLVGLQEGWANLTSAQEEQFVDSNLRGKWARVSGQVLDVWKTPACIIFQIVRKEPGPIEKTRLNVQLLFDSTNAASTILVNKGDVVNVRGEVKELSRNQYSVPLLQLSHCELLKD